jgi:Pyridoxamine 5'-phosphate oxidase
MNQQSSSQDESSKQIHTDDARSDKATAKTITNELSKTQCAVFLGSQNVGRLCVLEDGYPVAFPVNYRLVIDAQGSLNIIFHTRPGSTLDDVNHRVGFQIDGIDQFRQIGWSVICRGELRNVRSDAAPSWLESWDPHPWVGQRDAWLYLTVDFVTGRELTHPNNDWAANDHGYL